MIIGMINFRFDVKTAFREQFPKYKKAVVAGWKFWPPILLVMYRFVPVPFQNLFMDVFAFFYAVIISSIQSKDINT